jgi:hypothetical protein
MPISGNRYRPTTPNAQRRTLNAQCLNGSGAIEVLSVGRWALKGSLVASSLLSISSLTIPTKPQLLEVSGQAARVPPAKKTCNQKAAQPVFTYEASVRSAR